MLLDDTFHIIHTAIAHLYGVSVENFVVSVIIGKVFLYQVEEHLSYLGFHRLTEWGVKPNYVSFSISFSIPLVVSSVFVFRLDFRWRCINASRINNAV